MMSSINDRVTVRDCLNWTTEPTDSAIEHKYSANNDDEQSYERRRQPLEPQSPQWEDDSTAEQERRNCWVRKPVQQQQRREDEGTAGEALRGWPQQRREEAECRNKENEVRQPTTSTVTEKKTEVRKAKTATNKTGPGKNGRRSVVTRESEDAYIGDLLSQKYLEDYVAKSQAERTRKEEEQMAEKCRKSSLVTKGNKTAQLRSMAVASKLHAEQPELWKMSRFTKNAQPRLSTVGVGQRERSAVHGNGKQSCCAGRPAPVPGRNTKSDTIAFADQDTYYDCDTLAEHEIYHQ